jgi:hypothetical protein
MTIIINAQGTERKRLVQTISAWLDLPARYCGAPSFSYEVGCITIDKTGSLVIDDGLSDETIERLTQHLYSEEFDIDMSVNPSEDAFSGICISTPRVILTDANLANLHSIVDAKGALIRKALGVQDLPIEVSEHKVSFPWFPGESTPEEIIAYNNFICKLCDMARNQKRISAKEKEVDNEKYAFRCFLLRLGFIGDEFKTDRKILLRSLSGSTAFKAGSKKEVTVCE